MDGLTPLEDVEQEFAEHQRRIDLDLSIRRTLQRIDRALDCGNRREFMHLTDLLRSYKRKRR